MSLNIGPTKLLAAALFLLAFQVPAADIGDLSSLAEDDGAVIIRSSKGALLRLDFLADDVFRVRAASDGELTDEGSGKAPIVVDKNWPGASLEIKDLETHFEVRSEAVIIVVRPSPLTLELRRVADDQLLWKELRPLRLSSEGTTQTLSSAPDERFFGGGQQNGTFEFKGHLLEISYSGGWEEGDRPSPAPFFMSSSGYGILRNTWSDGAYDFRSHDHLKAFHAEDRFDAYFFVANSIHLVLDHYTRLTGRARLLPRWAFGYGDADCYNDDDNARKPGTVPEGWSDGPTGRTPDVLTSLAARYREHDMPGSWILPNDGYGCGYEELPAVVRELQELGFHTGLWTEDGVEKIAWEVGEAGTRAQKLDVAWTGKGYQWAMDANHDAAQGILDNSDSRPFLWTVMGWAGIQRYAVTWTGDQSGSWDYIRWHIPTLIGSGLSGMSYSTGDVDGIFGGSPETFTRDLQWKSFTPVLMGMSGWSRVARKHPWWYDERHRSIHRRFLKLRQRLMPYIYTLARETETTGAPMVRGIFWDFPDDGHAYDHPYQFFLGRDLLVAPVYRSQVASGGWRAGVYLPPGLWIDYWDGRVLDAGPEGRLVDIPVTLDKIPVLVRAGAIIPMYPESLYDGEVPPDPLTLDIYPWGESEYVLYEDDGSTREYQAGRFTEQGFQVKVDRGGRMIEVLLEPCRGEFQGMAEEREYVLQVHVKWEPKEVKLNDSLLPKLPNEALLISGSPGWRFDHSDRGGMLTMKLGRLDVRSENRAVLSFIKTPLPSSGSGYPEMPERHGGISPDALMVVGRPPEEPGHPVENAFDGDPATWFRTIRDQSVAYGPHELVLSLGERRVVEGFRISPRTDKYWRYGQVRSYEVHLADVNGQWGEIVAQGELDQVEHEQEVLFAPRVGRLFRLRVLSTHDDGADPMVLGAEAGDQGPLDALAPVRVGSTTISELRILEEMPSGQGRLVQPLGVAGREVWIDGLARSLPLTGSGEYRHDFGLQGQWHTLRAEAGIDDGSEEKGRAQFQVWGDGRLLWRSEEVGRGRLIKARVDIRGVQALSLRTVASHPDLVAHWVQVEVVGVDGATVE